MAGIGTYQIVDEDLTTVRFDMNDASGAANPGGLKTIARELHLRLPELEAVRFAPSSRPGGRTVFARDPLAVTTWKQAVLGSANNTYDEGARAFNELTRLLRAGGVIKFTPEGSTETRFIDFEPSDGVALFGDEPEDVFRALTSHAYPDGAPVTIVRQPHLRIAELDPALNVLANPTLLIDRNGDGRPEGWNWDVAPTNESIVAAEEAYEFTYALTAEDAFYQVPFLSAAPGEVWTASVEGRVVSGPGRWFIEVRFLNAADNNIGVATSAAQTGSTMGRVSITGTAPAGTAKVLWRYFVTNTSASAAVYRERRAQLEKSSSASRFRCSAQAFSNDPTLLGQGRILPIWVEGDAPCPIKLRLSVSTNHMTKNQSDVETDTTGWVGNAATVSRVTTEQQQGAASLQVVTNNLGVREGCVTTFPSFDIPVVVGRRYAFSTYLKRALGGTVFLELQWVGGAGPTVGPTITLTGTWTRHSVAGTAPAGATHGRLAILTDVQQALTFFVDAVQFEEGPVASTWVAGDSGNTGTAMYASRPSGGTVGGRDLADLLNRYHLRAVDGTMDTDVASVSDSTGIGGTVAEYRRDHHRVQHNVNDGNSTSPSVTWGATTVAGRTLLLVLIVDRGVTTGMNPTNPAGWTQVEEIDPLSDDHVLVRVLKIVNAAARSGAETFTLASAKPWKCFSVELQDVGDVDTLLGTTTVTDQLNLGATAATTQAYEYIFAVAGGEAAVAAATAITHGFASIESSTTNVYGQTFEKVVSETGKQGVGLKYGATPAQQIVGLIIPLKATRPALGTERRFRREVSTKLDSLRGVHRVLLRVKPLSPGNWTIQLRWAKSLGSATITNTAVVRDWTNIGSASAWLMLDLGRVILPETGDLAGLALEVWTEAAAAQEYIRFGSLFLVPDDVGAVLDSDIADSESWLGSILITPVSNPAGGTAGAVVGTAMQLGNVNNCGTPNKGAWPAGVHRFTFHLRNTFTDGEVAVRVVVRNITDSLDTATAYVTIPRRRGGVDGAGTASLYPTLVAGKTYQAQVDAAIAFVGLGTINVDEIERTPFPALVAREEFATDPAIPQVVVRDSSGRLSREAGVAGAVPDNLEPGLNLLYIDMLDPERVGFTDAESVLTRRGTLAVTHAPRYYL